MRPYKKDRDIYEDFDLTSAVGEDDTLLEKENYMDSQLKKRIKSLVWRAVMMGLATVITVFVDNLIGLGLPIWITGVLGLVLGEVSKHISNVYKQL